MIIIITDDYTTEQLKDLAFGLMVAEDTILKRYGCVYDVFCNQSCKGYAMCTDLFNAWCYLHKRIRERERLKFNKTYEKGEPKDDNN